MSETWRDAVCRLLSGDPLATIAVSWVMLLLVRRLQAAYSRSRHSVSNCSALLTETRSLIVLCVWNARPWSTPQVTMWAGHNVTTDGPLRARLTELAGRIWTVGRTLPTPGVDRRSCSQRRWIVADPAICVVRKTALRHKIHSWGQRLVTGQYRRRGRIWFWCFGTFRLF